MSLAGGRAAAIALCTLLVVAAPMTGTGFAVTESSEQTADPSTLSAPDVDAPNATIDDATASNITVSYNLSGHVSDGDLDVVLTSPKGVVTVNSSLSATGNATLTVPKDEFGGGEFQYVVYGWNNSANETVSGSFESAWLNVTSNASVTAYSVNRTTLTVGQDVRVNATLSNPSSTAENVTLGPYYDLESGTTNYLGHNLGRTVEVPANGEKNVSFVGNFSQTGDFDVYVNNRSATTVTVAEPVSFADTNVTAANVSEDIVSVDEAATLNVTLENPSSSDETVSFTASSFKGVDTTQRSTHAATVNASETKTVSVPVNYSEYGDWSTAVSGYSDTVTVLANGTKVVFNEGYLSANETVVAEEPQSFYVEATNYGDTAGSATLNLTYGNGTVVDNASVSLDSLNTTGVSFTNTFPETGEFNLVYEDDGEPFVQNLTVRPNPVVSTNLSVVSGTEPTGTVNVSASYDANGLSVKVVNASGTGELATEGVDATTEFQVNVTVQNLTSRVFVGSARNASWRRIQLNDTHTKHVFEGTPAEEQFLRDAPSLDNWPTNGTYQATFARQQTFSFTGFQLEGAPTEHQSRLNGTLIATDAQTFGTPQYVNRSGEEPKFTIKLAAPHYKANEVDGSKVVNDGYYEAQLPSQLVDDWGVSDPASELQALYQGSNKTFSAESLPDGGLAVSLDIHYSAGSVAVSPDTSDSTDDSTSDNTWYTGGDSDDEETEESTTPSENDTTRVVELADDAAPDAVSVTNVSAGTNVTIDFGVSGNNSTTNETETDAPANDTDAPANDTVTSDAPAAVETLNVSVESNASFTVNVSTSTDAPTEAGNQTESLPSASDTAAYVSVEHDGLTDQEIGDAALTLAVSKSRFDGRSDAANATVLRLHDGEWQHLNTTLVGETDDEYRFHADSPGLSVFAVVEPEPDIAVNGASLDAASVTVGDTVTVTATVSNDGGAGNASLKISLPGDDTVETVSLDANETTTVTFSQAVDRTGTFDVTVGNTTAGTLTVNAEQTATQTATATETTATATQQPTVSTTDSATSSTDTDTPGFGVLVALLALVAAAGVRHRT
ncbi:MAG: PGF-CTERM sorting domain-containing protein [Halobacterium sp.]